MRQLSPDEVGTLARNVRRHRRALGLRPAELAEYLGISAVYLTALEMGAIGRPFPEALTGLARLLDMGDWTELLQPPVTEIRPRSAVGRCPADTPTADSAERFLRLTGGGSRQRS
jgi:transcriptional regulator with XRE-family HTH domain